MHTVSPRHIATYYETLRTLAHQGALTEGATRIAFQNLLSDVGKAYGYTVVGEQTVRVVGGKTIRFDGEVRDQYKIRHGIWEAKDTADDLDSEIKKKLAAGYPSKNIIFENTQRAVLYQNGTRVLDLDITQSPNLQRVLDEFFSYNEPQIEEFHRAVEEFRQQIPALAASLSSIIEKEKLENRRFSAALDDFLELCKTALNPLTSLSEVEGMLKQHLLTERIFRSIFDNPDFVQRNAIARELEKVVSALTSRSFSRSQFLSRLDSFYRAIENAARTISDYSEKQTFLHAVYEQFFQAYSINTADTHGIVYTPLPIVKWMVASVEHVLQREFNLSLSDKGVHLLDPCVGTGTFILELMEHIGSSALPHKYAQELHCNEVLLLPYYIASQNIEHEYFERTGEYASFQGICFADTLDISRIQMRIFDPENTERIKQQQTSPIFVVIGNPPYNVGQINENDNNKNRKYPDVDKRVKLTYARSSEASNKKALNDIYVRFFRWATDRLSDRDGVICFVSNNSFFDDIAFDGMRKELVKDFTSIYALDLGGNVRNNPKLSGTTHNVFGIQVGVGITFLIRNRRGEPQDKPADLYYARVDEWWRKEQKFEFLNNTIDINGVIWETIVPDRRGTWINRGSADFFSLLPTGTKETKSGKVGALQTIFKTFSLGVRTNRDDWVSNFNPQALASNISLFIETYNNDVDRWRRRSDKSVSIDDFVLYDDRRIKWSRDLKLDVNRGKYAEFDKNKVRNLLYRPFCRKFIFFDRVLNEEVYVFPKIFPNEATEKENMVICFSGIGHDVFYCLMANCIVEMKYSNAANGGTQSFPFYTYDEDGNNRKENITDWALAQFQSVYGHSTTKWDIFYYIYGVLHSPEYRELYAANLQRDLPRIPMVDPATYITFRDAGQRLVELHIGYEQATEYRLKHIERREVPWTWRVEKMRLSKDRTQLIYNEALTLEGIPPEVFDYRLGNRSALEWVIDQYQVTTDKRSGILSDPNDAADPEKIVRLIKQVITVSFETIHIIHALPPLNLKGPLGAGSAS